MMFGRPILWGLAAGGEEGVGRVFDILKQEFINDLQLCGLSRANSSDRSILLPQDSKL